MSVESFEDLEIWQLSKELVRDVYEITGVFPESEKYGLIPQLRSAMVSVAANIAEAFGRYHLRDSVKFLYNARGSLLEVKSHLLIADELGFIKNEEEKEKVLKKIRNLGVKLNNFIHSLKEKLDH